MLGSLSFLFVATTDIFSVQYGRIPSGCHRESHRMFRRIGHFPHVCKKQWVCCGFQHGCREITLLRLLRPGIKRILDDRIHGTFAANHQFSNLQNGILLFCTRNK